MAEQATKFEVQVYKPKTEMPGLVAFVNLKIHLDIGILVVKDFSVRLGKEDGKRWVGAPGKVGKDKKFYESVHMVTKEGRLSLHEVILAAVAKELGADKAADAAKPVAKEAEEAPGFS